LNQFAGTSRFEVRRRLGQGGMGIVYEAWDRERRQAVALKTLREIDANALYRLKNEFRALRGLQHPNLISLGELIEDSGRWFYTMELVDGVDFLSYVRDDRGVPAIDREGHISPSADTMRSMRAAPVRHHAPLVNYELLRPALAQLAQGLDALHEAGKVHRDVKPSNVLIDPLGRLVLLDFGLIWDVSADDRRSMRHVVGTPEYMAPEQASGQAVGPPADWYSVGVLLYESLCGRAPFEGAPMRVLLEKQQRPITPPGDLVEGLPADLDELTRSLLAFEPEARPSGDQVMRALGVGRPSRSFGPAITQAPVFVGRERELGMLADAFDEVSRGACVCVAVCGESGLGKTALVRHFGRDLDDAERAIVLTGACYENELVPFKAVDGAIDDLVRALARLDAAELEEVLPTHVDLLARMFPVLGRIEAIAHRRVKRQSEPDPHEQRARAFGAFRRLLVALGKRAPVVLLIDDVQWADLDSARLLQRLLAPPDPPRLLVLLTARTRAEVAGSRIAEDARVVDLAPLDASAAHELSRRLTERSEHPGTLGEDAILADAGGHPFFIQELVRYAAVSGKPTEGIRLDDAIRARAAGLGASGLRLLELLAVSGAPLPQTVLRLATGLEPADFARQRAILCTVNLARLDAGSRDTLALYHSRVGEAVRGIPGVDPPRLHAELAQALERSGVAEQQPELVVLHLEKAGEPARAAAYARRAAERAAAQLAFERAAALFRTALRVGKFDRADTHALRLALGHALVSTGRGAEAADAFLEATDHDDPVIRLDCRRLAAEQLLVSGHIERGLELLERLLADIGTPLPRTPARTIAALLWQRLRLRARGLGWKERSASQVTKESLVHMDAARAVSHGLSMVDYVRGALFNARLVRLALDSGDLVRIGDALALEAVYVGCQGKRGLPRARALADVALELGARSQHPRLLAFAAGCDGTVVYFSGRFREAAAKMTASAEMLQRVAEIDFWELNNSRLFQIFAYRFLGALREVRTLTNRYLEDAISRGDAYFGTSLRRSSVGFELAAGNVATARERLDSATWPDNPIWFHVQSWYELEGESLYGLYTGEPDATLTRLEPTFARMDASPLKRVHIVWCLQRFLHAILALSCERRPEAEVLHLARATSRWLASGATVYSWPMAEILAAALAEREGRRDAARRHWARASARADAAEMADLAATARFRLGQLLGGDEGAELVRLAREWAASEGVAGDTFFDLTSPRRPRTMPLLT
jgi:tetratricopeptide (TPR) repeat protein